MMISRDIIFFLLILLPFVSSVSNILSAEDYMTISSSRTLVSPGDKFELGFFKLAGGSDDRWYFGMWYKNISIRDYVWIVHRNNAILGSNGTLKISGNNLVLHDGFGNLVWSSSQTTIPTGRPPRSPVVAELLPNGNFVLRYSTIFDADSYIWQRFNYPTDTLLPGMKLGWDVKTNLNRNITSWKSDNDPSTGDYTYRINYAHGFPQRVLLKRGHKIVHRSDMWNRVGTSGLRAEEQQTNGLIFNFTMTNQEVTYSFTVRDNKIHGKLKMSSEGVLERLSWPPTATGWIMLWYAPSDFCDHFLRCGNYSFCDMTTSSHCHCIKGFEPKNLQEWSLGNWEGGCQRKTQLVCDDYHDVFLPLERVKLPDTSAETIFNNNIDLQECRSKCARDCKCTGFAEIFTENSGPGCLIWKTEFRDIRVFPKYGQHLFVKLADMEYLREKRSLSPVMISITVLGGILVSMTIFLLFWYWHCKARYFRNRTTPNILTPNISTPNVPKISYDDILSATGNFGDQLGRGGYGVVYKGTLHDGQEVAVKRLTKVSGEGIEQFANEVLSVAKVQHINLVRLVGYCQHEKEYILVYEFLENLSLDLHLFGDTGRSKLNWRTRLDIVQGASRGLSYLHEDSLYRVTHRDLKGGNILLDKDMIPKIADFGMAQLVGRNETQTTTGTVVGTYGYISPEHMGDRVFSNKSDVYSFGIVLLEVLTGKRNTRFTNSEGDASLPICVWTNWKDGILLDIIDPFLEPSKMLQNQVHEATRYFRLVFCVSRIVQKTDHRCRQLLSSF